MQEQITKEIKAIWDVDATSYDTNYAHGIRSEKEKEEWLKLLREIIGEEKRKILDVGAGTGVITLLLRELGHELKAVDLSEGMLSVAKNKAEQLGYNDIIFEIGNAESLNEESGTYDIVINRHLLWTLPHPEQAIQEWLRVLKPSGQLIIIDGDWFNQKLSGKIQVFFGKIILSITERRNAFSSKGMYSRELVENLPMMHKENVQNLKSTLEKYAKSVTLKDAIEVEKAEKKAMPLGHRLKNPFHRRIFIATKE